MIPRALEPPACRYTALLLCALALLWASPVQSQGMACMPRDLLIEQLLKDYNESPVEFGILTGGQAVIERLQSPGGETWTMLLTRPDGVSCFIGAGEDWQTNAKAPKPKGDGA